MTFAVATSPWTQRFDDVPPAGEGPLTGTSVCVKDTIDVAGVPTGGGLLEAVRLPVTDATIVARLRAAGGLVVGKGHTNELAYGIDGRNAELGALPGPVDPQRMCGGSSSGPAVAVALGEARLGLGSDTSGSLRVPAAFCGIWSLRPTHGALPVDGLLPLAPELDVPGLLAADAATLAAGWAALSGTPAAAPDVSLAGLRVGALSSLRDDVDPVVAEAVRAFLSDLRTLGAVVEDVADDLGHRAQRCHAAVQQPSAAVALTTLLGDRWRELPDALVTRIEAGRAFAPAAVAVGREEAMGVRADVRLLLRRFDVLVAPAVAVPPPPIEAERVELPSGDVDVRAALMACSLPFSQAGVPVLTLPRGLAGAAPVGVQLAAAPGREPLLLALAHHLEDLP